MYINVNNLAEKIPDIYGDISQRRWGEGMRCDDSIKTVCGSVFRLLF